MELMTKFGKGGEKKGPRDQPEASSLVIVALITSGLSSADFMFGVLEDFLGPWKPMFTP